MATHRLDRDVDVDALTDALGDDAEVLEELRAAAHPSVLGGVDDRLNQNADTLHAEPPGLDALERAAA